MKIWIIALLLFVFVAALCLNRINLAFFSVEQYLNMGQGENVMKYRIYMIPIWTSHKKNDVLEKYISRYHLRSESEILLFRHGKRILLQGTERVSGFPFRLESYLRSDEISEEHKKKLILLLQNKKIEAYMRFINQLHSHPIDIWENER